MDDASPERAGHPPSEPRLRDLRPTEAPVIIVARVVSVRRREITRKSDGGRRPVLSGHLTDGTATVPFTWWDPPNEDLDPGTVLRAGPVQVREYRGRMEVSFNWKTRFALAAESDLPRVRVEDLPAKSLGQLRDGDEGFRVDVRVLRVAPKTVSVGEDRRLLHEGAVLDRSGELPFTAWSDFSLRPDETIRIVGGFVRSFRGRPQLTLDERSSVARIPATDLPTRSEWAGRGPTSIASAEAARGGDGLLLEGLVVALLPPSAVVFRCPECRRSLSEQVCRTHGKVDPVPDLRARIALDDGTGVATVNADRTTTERLWGRTLDECLARLRADTAPSVLEGELLDSLLGQRLRAVGRGTFDDFGLTIFPETVQKVEADPTSAVGRLERRLAEGPA